MPQQKERHLRETESERPTQTDVEGIFFCRKRNSAHDVHGSTNWTEISTSI